MHSRIPLITGLIASLALAGEQQAIAADGGDVAAGVAVGAIIGGVRASQRPVRVYPPAPVYAPPRVVYYEPRPWSTTSRARSTTRPARSTTHRGRCTTCPSRVIATSIGASTTAAITTITVIAGNRKAPLMRGLFFSPPE